MSDLMVRGPLWGGTGSPAPFTGGISGYQRTADAHGRYMDAALGGRLFSTGSAAAVAINNATFTLATTGVTATPIVGVWNPASNTVNLVILQAMLTVYMTSLTAMVGPGGFVWMGCVGNSVISTGLTPVNRRTLVATGSVAKGFAGTALTGMTGALATISASSLSGGSNMGVAFTETAVGARASNTGNSIENIDGAIIVPPGGVLALMAAVTPVVHSAVSGLLWEEVPIIP